MNETGRDIIEMERTDENKPAVIPDLKNQVVQYSVTLAQIAKLKEEYAVVPDDLTVKSNYALVKKAASHLRGLRGDVEARRKVLKADALIYGRKVDAAAKEITEKLVEIEEPFATAKKNFDTKIEIEKREKALAEERRVDAINERIAAISVLVQAHISSSSKIICSVMDDLERDYEMVDEWAEEFKDKAYETLKTTMEKLTELSAMKFAQETAEDARIATEAKRAEEEEAARVAKEAELEKSRQELDAERDRLAEKNKRILAEAAEREAKIKAEQDEKDRQHYEELRIAQEQQEKDRASRAAIQAEKDIAAAAELQAMKDKLQAIEDARLEEIKKQREQEEANKPVVQETITIQGGIAQDNNTATESTEQSTPFKEPSYTLEQYREAGNAMLAFIGNKTVTKALLDAIIKGKIINIYFQGV